MSNHNSRLERRFIKLFGSSSPVKLEDNVPAAKKRKLNPPLRPPTPRYILDETEFNNTDWTKYDEKVALIDKSFDDFFKTLPSPPTRPPHPVPSPKGGTNNLHNEVQPPVSLPSIKVSIPLHLINLT